MSQANRARSGGLFRLFGVHIRIHPSWLLFAVFIAWALATGALPQLFEGLPQRAYWGMAGMVVVGLAISIVLHEMGHTLAARALGLPIDRITLFALGGIAELKSEPKAPKAEFLMAVAGPVVSVVLSFVFGFAAGMVDALGGRLELAGALAYLATLNMVLAIFNMVPAFPLDGGRVLRSVIWMRTGSLERATRIATGVGAFFGLALIAGAVVMAFTGNLAAAFWWFLIGVFLRWSAQTSRQEVEAKAALTDVRVADLMAWPVETVPADLPLDAFVAQRLFATRHGLYPVLEDGAWIGVIDAQRVLRTPREAWPATRVGQVCAPAEETPTADPWETAAEALAVMRERDTAYLPVIDRGALVGMLALRDVLGRLDLERAFKT